MPFIYPENSNNFERYTDFNNEVPRKTESLVAGIRILMQSPSSIGHHKYKLKQNYQYKTNNDQIYSCIYIRNCRLAKDILAKQNSWVLVFYGWPRFALLVYWNVFLLEQKSL